MTKQEQIHEIAKYMCNVCDFKCDSFLSGEFCVVAMENAEAIYNKVEEEINQLKTECTLLDDELRNARQETINVLNELKTKLFTIFGKTICSDLDTEDITDIIDELLEEQK